jgi:hypothetical protein
MSAEVFALIVAVVGVAGTLASALLTQTLSLRAKRTELDEQRRQRFEERDETRRRTEFKDRRDSCVALNMAARRFRQALKNCVFEGIEEKGSELEEARQEFTSRYGEAQMILSDAILNLASAANGQLAQAYGKVKAGRQPGATQLAASEQQELVKFLDHEVQSALRELRGAMRRDLGVADWDQAL